MCCPVLYLKEDCFGNGKTLAETSQPTLQPETKYFTAVRLQQVKKKKQPKAKELYLLVFVKVLNAIGIRRNGFAHHRGRGRGQASHHPGHTDASRRTTAHYQRVWPRQQGCQGNKWHMHFAEVRMAKRRHAENAVKHTGRSMGEHVLGM